MPVQANSSLFLEIWRLRTITSTPEQRGQPLVDAILKTGGSPTPEQRGQPLVDAILKTGDSPTPEQRGQPRV